MKRSGLTVWASALLLILAGGITRPAQAQSVPTPDNDPFYVPPAGYQALPNGAVLRDRSIDAQFLLPFLSTNVTSMLGSAFGDKIAALQNLKINAYQVLYKSTDSHDQPTSEVATVLVPQGPWLGNGPRPLVAYQLDEDSVTTLGAPSYTLRTGLLGQGVLAADTFEVSVSLPALLEGYAIVYSDYEGPQSQWIAGKQEGHGVLDGIRAVLNYAPAGLTANTPIALWGYSGGAGATGWAAALRQSYSPELNVVGAAIGANPNSDLAQMYTNNDGKLSSGLLVMAIVGLDRAFPEAGIDAYLNAAGTQLLAGAQNMVTIEAAIAYPVVGPIENYTIAPNVSLVNSAPGRFIFPTNSLVNQSLVPDMPILNYHDEFDELVPVKADNDLALKYCKAGANIEVMRTSTPVPFVALIHIAGEIEGWVPALNYITNRFNGVAPRNDCGPLATAVWASPLPLAYYPFVTQ